MIFTLPSVSRTAVSLSAVVCRAALLLSLSITPMLHQRGSGPVEVMR